MFRTPMKPSHRVFAALFLIGMLSALLPDKERVTPVSTHKTAEAQNTGAQNTGAQNTEAQNNEDKEQQCFALGTGMAIAYMANIQKMSEVGLLASDVMEKGCEQQVGHLGETCVNVCKLSFKVEAQRILNSWKE